MADTWTAVFPAAYDADDPEAKAEAMQKTHDMLLAAHPVRIGGIKWSFFGPEVTEPLLRDLGFDLDDPDVIGLIAYMTEEGTDRVLVIASLELPEAPHSARNM